MGYHIVYPNSPGYAHDVPAIRKDGGTGAWREAKALLRKWYLDQAYDLREVTERSYFIETPVKRVIDSNKDAQAAAYLNDVPASSAQAAT